MARLHGRSFLRLAGGQATQARPWQTDVATVALKTTALLSARFFSALVPPPFFWLDIELKYSRPYSDGSSRLVVPGISRIGKAVAVVKDKPDFPSRAPIRLLISHSPHTVSQSRGGVVLGSSNALKTECGSDENRQIYSFGIRT